MGVRALRSFRLKVLARLLLGCRDRRLTRPFTIANARGEREWYVACLDCGRRLAFDVDKMRVGSVMR